MIHTIKIEQWLPCSIDEAWAFFSRPENLQKITPPDVAFKTLSQLPDDIYPGLMILYRVSPFKGIPMRWVTEITHVNKPHYFVDEQRYGPYAMWHHEHHFEISGDGVMMTDLVYYKLPLGWFGNLFHGMLVKAKLKKIFDYRREVIGEQFKK